MTKMIKHLLIPILCVVVAGVCTAQAQPKQPLKVFVLVGQSNMQGHAHVRTLQHIGMDSKTKSLLDDIQDKNGKPRVCEDVWISYLSSGGVKSGQLTVGFGADDNKIGPELTFGIYMQKKLKQPILIIKTAWGGKSINTDFRPPSAGPYVFDQSVLERLEKQKKDIKSVKAQKEKATGVFYRKTIEHVKKVLADIKSVYPKYDPEQGYQLAGIVWFQGWNDMVDRGTYPRRGETGGYGDYSKVLAHLIRDFRKDLSAPNLPFVIGVMGAGGPTEKYSQRQQRYKKVHQNFRDAMAQPATMKEFKGNVVAVLTENCWDMELDALLERDGQIRNQVRNAKKENKLDELIQKIDKDQTQAALKKTKNKNKLEQALVEFQRKQQFNERELQILKHGRSNAAYHYLGCSKIMAQIGKAFAEAMPSVKTGK